VYLRRKGHKVNRKRIRKLIKFLNRSLYLVNSDFLVVDIDRVNNIITSMVRFSLKDRLITTRVSGVKGL